MFDGVLPPIATPFVGERLDLGPLDDNLDRWMATGLRGVLVLGTNGEAPYVDDDEADALIEAVRARVPAGRTVLVGTGRESTRTTVEASVRAAGHGADAVLVRPPTTYRGQMTDAALEEHVRAVADACPVPVLLYNQPLAFGVELSAALVARLSTHPNVRGLKESSGNVGLVGEHVAGLPSGFPVLTGVASTMYASLLVGATGVIVAVANVVPELCVRLYDLVRAGRMEEALLLQRAITPLGRAVTAQFGVPGLKAAMTLAGYAGTEPRRPLQVVPAETVTVLRNLMRELSAQAGVSVLADET
jgi:4-hydroxy-2-oxoglutarate aldolase